MPRVATGKPPGRPRKTAQSTPAASPADASASLIALRARQDEVDRKADAAHSRIEALEKHHATKAAASPAAEKPLGPTAGNASPTPPSANAGPSAGLLSAIGKWFTT